MSDVTPTDKDIRVIKLLANLHVNIWQVDAGANLVRDLAINAQQEPDSQHEMEKLKLACNGLLAAASHITSDLDDLQGILDVANPDWSVIHANLQHGYDIREQIEGRAS